MTSFRWSCLVLLVVACDGPTPLDGGVGDDAPGRDVPGLDAPVLPDAPIEVPPGEVPLCVTALPADGPEIVGPGRGAELWNNSIWTDDERGVPTVPAGFDAPADEYYRFSWSDIETTGGYDWAVFDREIDAAIDERRTFNFGIMNLFTAIPWTNVDGGGISYPLPLHEAMQAAPAGEQDWLSDGSWIPNWNSPHYLSAWRNLLMAVADHIATGSHAGVAYRDAIGYVDVRGYGDFGEWHTYPWYGTEPPGREATAATLIAILDASVEAFPDFPLVNLMGVFDPGNASRIPAEVTHHALTVENAYGRLGWRRDNWGDDGYDGILRDNDGTLGGVTFGPLIMDAWEHAPIVGEPLNDLGTISRGCGSIHCDLLRQVRTYHATSFGNGNYPVLGSDGALAAAVREASAATGYRIQIEGGSISERLDAGAGFALTVLYRNVGLAPPYYRWRIDVELRPEGGAAVWTGASSFSPTGFLPAASATEVRDVFMLPDTLPAGTYELALVVRDPADYRVPLPLAVENVGPDGAVVLRRITLGATAAVCP